MIKHINIWKALDRLAETNGLSASGLAKKAGLDPTSFNPSKRSTPQGKLRWPSTESIAKVLAATGASFTDFVNFVETSNDENYEQAAHQVPLIGFAEAGQKGYFDDGGFPVGSGWDKVPIPHMADPQAYALEVSGDSMEPMYREGDILVVSPTEPVRRNDRVVVKTLEGEVMAKVLARKTANKIELKSFNPAHQDRAFDIKDIDWIARIVWVSQ